MTLIYVVLSLDICRLLYIQVCQFRCVNKLRKRVELYDFFMFTNVPFIFIIKSQEILLKIVKI